MHILQTDHEFSNRLIEKVYVLAFVKVKGIGLPNKIRVVTPRSEKTYNISGYFIDGIKIEHYN